MVELNTVLTKVSTLISDLFLLLLALKELEELFLLIPFKFKNLNGL